MASWLPFLKRKEKKKERTKPDYKTFIHGNHYTRECSGMEGRDRMGEKPGTGFWSWSPHTLPFRYKCIQALFINKYSSWPHQPSSPHPPTFYPTTPSGIASHTLVRSHWTIPPCARSAVWVAPGRAPFLPVIAWRGWSCSQSSLVLNYYIWFLFLFGSPFSLSLLASLPPS